MTTVGDLRAIDDLLKLPGVESTALRLVYAADYYDGPLSGLLVYQDTTCWFEAYDPHPPDDDRIYMIVALSPEQREQEEHWHALFQEKVGRHWDFDYEEQGDGLVGIARRIAPPEAHHEFYEQYNSRQPRDLSPNEVLGWFTM